MSPRKIALAVCALAVCGYSVYRLYAQDPAQVDPPAGPPTFAALVAADEAAEGRSKADSARVFADWMKANAWQNLPMEDQRVLVDKLDLDEVDFPNFSVRWTGSLTPAESGEYTFVQGKQLKKTSPMKVWLNDKLELDSSTSAYESKPVSLQAGQVVSIRVEVVHDSFYRVGYSEGAPIAVLAWKRAGQSPQLIPTSAYTPPVGFADGENGLKGEYFASTNHEGSTLKSTQLDPGVEFSWAWSPVVATYADETKAVKAKLWDQLETGQAFNARANDKAKFLDDALWQTAHRLPLSKRKQIVDMLQERPGYLRDMSPYAMGKFMESVYMLPGGGHVELLKSWAQTRPQPKTEIGQYPGWGEGFFRTKNSEFYWLIGHFLQGDNWQHVERLWQDDLRRPNGECNLPLVYATAFTAHTEGKGRDLLNLLDAAIDDETLNGNQKATWLIAKAFTLGALVDGEPRPMRGYQYLQEALLVAQSKPVRFWALQEMVARHASLDQADKANQLIEQYRGQFSDAESQGKFAAWSQQAEELKQKYVEVRKQPNFEPLEIYIAEVKRRLAKAQSNQKSDKATRLQAILQRAEQKLAAKEAL